MAMKRTKALIAGVAGASMKKIVLVLAVLAVSACGTRTTKVIAPDGQPALAMRCKTLAHCFEAAGQQCPNGYDRIDRDTAGSRGGGVMLIRCKE